MELFDSNKTVISLPNAELIYYPHFYSKNKSDDYFKLLEETIPWQQDNITLFGKTHKQPRLTSLFSTNDLPYTYSNITMQPHYFTKELLDIKTDIELITECEFTTVLLNLYRDGTDGNGWHADNEKELGKNPVIASLSFGHSRLFHFKHRTLNNEKHKLVLEPGSLLIMKGEMQHHWLHQIPKTQKQIASRINLTFRTIKEKVEVPQPRLF